ncbi:MAG: hypothetical protein NZ928_07015 [Endomicrobia bacterium]|nr:hypothetical protein [Endomicrobiia bacterium]MCX7940677.1 hypothetical protein [Endomicrobiia bacterium]
MTAKDRRKKLRIVHKLQIKYTLRFLVPFFVILLIIELQMIYVIKLLLPHVEFLIIRNEIIRTLIFVMFEVLVILGIVAVYNITYLHRLVGPINRLMQEIDEMVKNKNYHLLTVRKDDELLPLVNKFNLIIEQLTKK